MALQPRLPHVLPEPLGEQSQDRLRQAAEAHRLQRLVSVRSRVGGASHTNYVLRRCESDARARAKSHGRLHKLADVEQDGAKESKRGDPTRNPDRVQHNAPLVYQGDGIAAQLQGAAPICR